MISRVGVVLEKQVTVEHRENNVFSLVQYIRTKNLFDIMIIYRPIYVNLGNIKMYLRVTYLP